MEKNCDDLDNMTTKDLIVFVGAHLGCSLNRLEDLNQHAITNSKLYGKVYRRLTERVDYNGKSRRVAEEVSKLYTIFRENAVIITNFYAEVINLLRRSEDMLNVVKSRLEDHKSFFDRETM